MITLDTTHLPESVAYAMVYICCVDSGGIGTLSNVLLSVETKQTVDGEVDVQKVGDFAPQFEEHQNKLGAILATQTRTAENWDIHFRIHTGDIFWDCWDSFKDDAGLSHTFSSALDSEEKAVAKEAAVEEKEDGDNTEKVLVERNGKFEYADAADVISFDHLEPAAEPEAAKAAEVPANPSIAAAVKETQERAKSAASPRMPRAPGGKPSPQQKRRAKSAHVGSHTSAHAAPSQNQSVGHSAGFKGPPGSALTRFKNVEMRDHYKSWYNSKRKHFPKKKAIDDWDGRRLRGEAMSKEEHDAWVAKKLKQQEEERKDQPKP